MQLRPNVIRQRRGRGLLDHLLVPALQRTVPITERHHAARAVAEDLHLDMTRVDYESFDEDTPRPEAALGQPSNAVERPAQFRGIPADLHADAPAAAGRLEHHGISELAGCGGGRGCAVQQIGTGEHRDTRRPGRRAGGVLGAEHAQLVRRRAHENQAGVFDGGRELGVLGEESITGMDHVGTGRGGGIEDRVHSEVALARRRRAKPHRVVGETYVRRRAVGVGEHRDRAQAEQPSGPHQPHGDLSTIGDQHGARHDDVTLATAPSTIPLSPSSLVNRLATGFAAHSRGRIPVR